MSTTRLEQIGIGGKPYGVFAPKAGSSAVPHNPGIITRLCQSGVGVAKYGTFLPKVPAPPIVVRVETTIAPTVTVGWPKKKKKQIADIEKIFAVQEIHWPGMIWPTGKRSTENVTDVALKQRNAPVAETAKPRQIPVVSRDVARKMGLALGKHQQAILVNREDEELLLLLGAFD